MKIFQGIRWLLAISGLRYIVDLTLANPPFAQFDISKIYGIYIWGILAIIFSLYEARSRRQL